MSSVAWSMSVAGSANGSLAAGEYQLGAIGVERPQCTFRSLDDDEFTFEIKQSATTTPALAYGERVILYRTTAGVKTTWFYGTVTKVSTMGSGATETIRYVVSGPWFLLKTTLWQVACMVYLPSTQTCALVSQMLSKVVLFQDPILGSAITTGVQIQNVITYAQSLGIAITTGTVPAFVNVPFEETRDLTLIDVIRRCMQWTPQGVTWFNYAAGSPQFNAQDRSLLSGVTINMLSENLVVQFELTPRSDLVPTGVVFNYVGFALCNVIVPTGCADPSTGIVNAGAAKLSANQVQVQTITQDTAGLIKGPGVLVGTIDLTQLSGTTSENPPIGLALQYYTYLLTPPYDGVVETMEQECSGTLRPGLVLNISNGQTPWATMNNPIQQVTEDLYTGVTTAHVGTPQHLAPQTFAYLVNMTARRPLVTSGLAAVNFPGAGGNSCPQGITPAAQKLINQLQANTSGAAAAIMPGYGLNAATCVISICTGGALKNLQVYCPEQVGSS